MIYMRWMLFIVATFLFMIAIHEIDLSMNMSNDCIDTNYLGVVKTKAEMYRHGFFCMMVSYLLFFLSFVLSNYRVKIPLNYRDSNN